ncbi:MAG: hypothetical protein ACYSUI_09185 [Planctomycetota bacterium]
MKQIPVVAWLACAFLLLVLGRYVVLLVRQRRSAAASRAALGALRSVVGAIRGYAASHRRALPEQIGQVASEHAAGFVYRPVPDEEFDGRLVLLYDRVPQHLLLEFPGLRPGRAVYLLGGKTLLVSEEQLEKLIAADSVLRAGCGLEPLALITGQGGTTNE